MNNVNSNNTLGNPFGSGDIGIGNNSTIRIDDDDLDEQGDKYRF